MDAQVNYKILLVEDDAAYSDILTQLLVARGYEVVHATNRHQGLLFFQQDIYGFMCVLQDLGLPPHTHGIDEGLACIQDMLKLQPQLSIIVLTGRDRGEAGIKAIRMGAFDYLEKPVALAALLAALERAVLFFKTQQAYVAEGIVPLKYHADLGQGFRLSCDQFEQALITRVLAECDYNIRHSAEVLGMKRENLYYLIRKYQIEVPRPSSDQSCG